MYIPIYYRKKTKEKFATKNIQVKFLSVSEQNRAPTDLFVYFCRTYPSQECKIYCERLCGSKKSVSRTLLLLLLSEEKNSKKKYSKEL